MIVTFVWRLINTRCSSEMTFWRLAKLKILELWPLNFLQSLIFITTHLFPSLVSIPYVKEWLTEHVGVRVNLCVQIEHISCANAWFRWLFLFVVHILPVFITKTNFRMLFEQLLRRLSTCNYYCLISQIIREIILSLQGMKLIWLLKVRRWCQMRLRI